MKNLIFVFLAIFLFSSCVTYKNCSKKFSTVDTVFITRDSTIIVNIPVPSDSISISFVYDTIKVDTVYQVNNDSSHIVIRYWIDKYNKLFNIVATKPEIIVHDTIIINDTIPCPPVNVFKDDIKKNIWDKYKGWAAILFPVTLLFIWLFRRR